MVFFTRPKFVVASNFLLDQLSAYTLHALIKCAQSSGAWFESAVLKIHFMYVVTFSRLIKQRSFRFVIISRHLINCLVQLPIW